MEQNLGGKLEKSDLEKSAPAVISERNERLLIAYHDNQCGLAGRYFARRLLRRSTAARSFFEFLQSIAVYVSAEKQDGQPKIDLWNRISARIDAEQRADSIIRDRAARSTGMLGRFVADRREWRARLAWGTGGAAMASVCSLILIHLGLVGGAARTAVEEIARSSTFNAPLVAPASYTGALNTASSPLEVDWMRSSGQVNLLQDPSEKTAIIWVKPRAQAPQVALQTDYSSFTRKLSRSNTHIPVAIQVSGGPVLSGGPAR